MGEKIEVVDAACKLDFRPQNQFALEFYKPADDGYSTTTKGQNDEVNKYLEESKARRDRRGAQKARQEQLSTRGAPVAADPNVAALTNEIRQTESLGGATSPSIEKADAAELDVAGAAKKAGRKDHISALFQVPKMRPDSTTSRDAHADMTEHCIGVDKEFHFKRNAYTEYTEDVVRYKHTMR